MQGKWRAWVPVYNAMVLAKLGDFSPWVMLGAIVGVQRAQPGAGDRLAALARGAGGGRRRGLAGRPEAGQGVVPAAAVAHPRYRRPDLAGHPGLRGVPLEPGSCRPRRGRAPAWLTDTTVWDGVPVQPGAGVAPAGAAGGYAAPPRLPPRTRRTAPAHPWLTTTRGVGAWLAFVLIFLPILLLFAIAGYVIGSYFLMRIFDKAGVQGKWRALVPVYNLHGPRQARRLLAVGDAGGDRRARACSARCRSSGGCCPSSRWPSAWPSGWRVGEKLGKEWYWLLLWLIPGRWYPDLARRPRLGLVAVEPGRGGRLPGRGPAGSRDTTVWQGIPVQAGAVALPAAAEGIRSARAPGGNRPRLVPARSAGSYPPPGSYPSPTGGPQPPAASYPPPRAPQPPTGPPAPPTAPPAAPPAAPRCHRSLRSRPG